MAPRRKGGLLRRAGGWLRARALSTFNGIFGSPAASGYAGGRLTRLTQDWVMQPLSADQELKWNLRAIRARARELVRDNPYAKRFIHLFAANVVGPHGIRLECDVRKVETGDPHAAMNDQVEQAWEDWSRCECCSVDQRFSFEELQRLMAKSLPQDGEVLIRLVPYFKNDYAFAIQLLDPDQLDWLLNRPRGTNGENEIRMGVELDEWGAPVAYHIWSSHPSEYEYDTARERLRIPADQIIHAFVAHRVGQHRGVSWFHPIMLSLKMYDGYQEAELVAARTAAATCFTIETDPSAVVDDANAPGAGERIEFEIEPGLARELDPGKKMTMLSPTHPVNAFEPFSKAVLKSIAAGLGVTYASLTADLSEANYSSLRAGLLPERDEWRSIQRFFIEHIHRRIYEAWLPMAVLMGKVTPGRRDPTALRDVNWLPRGWEWIDPDNEMRAHALAIDYGLESRSEIVAEKGKEVEDVLTKLGEEQKLAVQAGADIAPVAVKPVTALPRPGTPAPDNPNEAPLGPPPPPGQNGHGFGGRLAALK